MAERCRDQPGVQGWWLGMQRQHGRHPVVKELEQAQVAAAKLKLQGPIQLFPASAAAVPLPQPKAECSPAVLDAIAQFCACREEVPPEPACTTGCLVMSVKSSIPLILPWPPSSHAPSKALHLLPAVGACKSCKDTPAGEGGRD